MAGLKTYVSNVETQGKEVVYLSLDYQVVVQEVVEVVHFNDLFMPVFSVHVLKVAEN